MNWFLIALIGPVLYAISNHIDKYILERYFKDGEAGAVVLFSSLFSVIALPIIYIIDPEVFSLSIKTSVILLLNGSLNIFCLILYFKALRDDDVSTVVPFYQMIPVFSFILGYFVLGEVLSLRQIFACVLIIIGAIILSFDLTGAKIYLKKRVVFLMLLSAFLYGVEGVIFKFIAMEQGIWVSAFWDFSGNLLIGVLLFIFVASYRKDFLWVMKVNSLSALSVCSFNEFIFLIAEGSYLYAVMLAPVVLINTVNGFQPAFVFILGIILTLFFPKIVREPISKNILIQKISAIGVITAGTVILGLSGAL
jgi:drug/metabolite transporter (DMT)-like permease